MLGNVTICNHTSFILFRKKRAGGLLVSPREDHINKLVESVFGRESPILKSSVKRIIDPEIGRKKGKWQESNWAKILYDPTCRNSSHYNGMAFRQRFRVPYEIFLKICEVCRGGKDPVDASLPWFNKAAYD